MPLFRSRLQGDLLARVYLGEDTLTVSDLARELQAPVATVQREVQRLEGAGVLKTSRVGRARVVAADEDNPAFNPLRQLVLIAFGPRQVVAEEFADVGAESVSIFGSWAARYHGDPGRPPGDVDVLLVGQPDRDETYDAAERAQRRLGRAVNTTIVSANRWAEAHEPVHQGGQAATDGDRTSGDGIQMTWNKGREVIESLLAQQHLEPVPADPDEAQYLIDRARRYLQTAAREADDDPEIAYDAVYAAARKALTAVLMQQGLRPTRAGVHEVVIQAAEAQLVPPLGTVLRPFRRLRRQRGQGDYMASEGAISGDDVRADIPPAAAIVEAAARVIPELTVFTPRT